VNDLNEQLQPSSSKKPYQEPRLQVYGDIRTMTGSVSSKTKNADAGKGTKTI